ncbi:MAG: hypothetical protein DRH08_00675 [Deltaproteobacteria bacterium]|nr:MAG: hypothetical protein DRH08_00675 [Deltaproteobacteria bacterium]
MIPLTNPKSDYEEDYHRHNFFSEDGSHLATIEFDDIEDEGSGKLFCEIAVYCRIGITSERPLIAFERVNLLNRGAARGWLMSIVGKLNDMGSLNWEQGLDFAVHETIVNYRSSSSDGRWATWGDDNGDAPYLLRPFIANTGVTVLYGPPGSNKSMLALRLALGIATGDGYNGEKPLRTGPVMYVDFEDEARTHEYRLAAMARELNMEPKDVEELIWHERITRNLKDAKRRLRRIVRDREVALVIIDSIGLARAADVSGSEATIKLFKMFGQLGASVLAIDHMTKEDNKRVWTGKMDAREATPIGSQFTQSSARLAWFMNVMPQSTSSTKQVNLYNTKHNHTPKHDPIGMTIRLAWNRNDILTGVKFEINEGSHDSIVADAMKMTKAQELLLWHFKQQREEGGVIPMTLKDMGQSGINSSTIRGIVTEKTSAIWWEPVPGSKQHAISTDGLEAASFVNSMFGGTKRGTNGGGQDG